MVSESNKKTKILYVITKSNWGGAQRYVYDLATGILKKKYDVIVVLGGKGRLKTKLEEAKIETISINRLSRDINIFADITVFFNLLRLFKKERPDIIHLNSSKIGGIGALAGRLTKVQKIIFTSHGWAWGEDRNAMEKIVIKLFSWITIILSHTTITVSEYDEKIAKGLPFVNKKITTIHNGIPKINFHEKNTAQKILLNETNTEIKENTIWLGSIGELHKNKGFDYTIEALSILKKTIPNFIFIIIGEGEEKKNLEDLIRRHKLEKHIFIIKHEENASILLKAFDIFLLSSIKEGLPYTILEAGAAGITIIASAVGGIPEIVTNLDSGILLRSKNPSTITEAIKYISRHKDKKEEFNKRIKEIIKNNFLIAKMMTQTIKVYSLTENSKIL